MTWQPDLEGFDLVTRHIVMSRHLNAFGNLFGGVVLSWLDESSALYVMESTGYPDVVTVSMDDVFFKTPAHRGDCVIVYCRILKTGRSSVTVQTKAVVYHPTSGDRRELITCSFVFVCLKDGQVFPYFESQAYKQWKLHGPRAEALATAEAREPDAS